jgi:fermentation-respiration switch protein FrsA (DUF1100 family)
MIPGRWLAHNQFDNLGRIASCPRPLLVAHGTADALVPFAQGVELFEAAREPKCLYPLDGVSHHVHLDAAFFERLRDFLSVAEAEPSRRKEN